MAAKIFSTPREIGEMPSFKLIHTDGYEAYAKATREFEQKIVDFAKKHGKGDYKGEEIRFQVGDGYARYIVFSSRPLHLIHVPTGDAWHFQYVDRMTLADIKEQVRQNKAMAKLFGNKSIGGNPLAAV